MIRKFKIKCHHCLKSCKIEVEIDNDNDTETIIEYCEKCKNPSRIDYQIMEYKIVRVQIDDGSPLIASFWENPHKITEFKKHQKRTAFRRRKIEKKWFEMQYPEAKKVLKTVFKYWKKNPPLSRKDSIFRDSIIREWKNNETTRNWLKNSYDGKNHQDYEDTVNKSFESFKRGKIRYYNLDGSMDIQLAHNFQ